jgi:hypothetical protein
MKKNQRQKFSSKTLNDSKDIEESKDYPMKRTSNQRRRREGQRAPFKPEFSGDN